MDRAAHLSILTRDIERDVLPTLARYGYGVLSYSPLAGGWLSDRCRRDAQSGPAAAARPQNRFDLSVPENQRKLDAADALARLGDQAGITLIEMAIAFVLRHPAITSAIIGLRTMDQLESQLTAADVQLSDDLLDAIDAVVAPGVTLNPADDCSLRPAGAGVPVAWESTMMAASLSRYGLVRSDASGSGDEDEALRTQGEP